MRHVDPNRHRILFSLGIGLIVANLPIGWGGLIAGAAVAALTQEPRWLLAGAGFYVFSWVLLGLGVWIAGKAGLERARWIMHRRTRLQELLHWRRLRRAATAAGEPTPPAPLRRRR